MSFACRQTSKSPCINPYYDFLQKTEREQVRWTSKYLLPETEMEKGLVKRADDLTNQVTVIGLTDNAIWLSGCNLFG